MGAVDSEGVFSVGGGNVEKIFVSVRLRPLNEKEIAANERCDWECINDTTIIYRCNYPDRYMPPSAYAFDRVFQCDCSTKQVYEESAKEIALSVVSGINSTIFAYGQTSSGKTYTMSGITEYTVADIYDYIHRHEERTFVLKFSAIEIYNEAVRDLLSLDSTPLRLLDDPDKGTIVEKLVEETLTDWNHLKSLISVCEAQRKIGETSLNETSSRSHQILRLTIESSANEFSKKDNSSKLVASVNFVDLAGSERASQALSAGTRLKEGCHINRSLLTLGTVIRKLSKGRNGHIPYRDSKLTRILQPALGGNARTAIICTMCPARSHIEQSRNTLLFASCAKEVVTNAQVNVVMSDKALVKQLQKQLAILENELRYPGITPNFEMLLKEKDSQIRKMEKEIKELTLQRDLAQSQLQNLLHSVEDRASRQWEQSSQNSMPNMAYGYEDTVSTSSDIIDHSLNSVSSKFTKSYNQQHLQRRNMGSISPRNSISSPMYSSLTVAAVEKETNGHSREDLEELCKVVQCIEMNVVERSDKSNSSLTERNHSSTHMNAGPSNLEMTQEVTDSELTSGSYNTNPITLEQHLQCVRKPFNNFSKAYPDVSSPWPAQDSVSRRRALTRSKSCRPTLSNSSPWFLEVEQNDDTPPTGSFKNFPGRPEGYKKRRFALNYDAEADTLSVEGSEYSKYTTSYSGGKPQDGEVSEEQIVGIHDFVAELKEMAQAQYQKQHNDPQNADEDNGTDGTVKDVGLDPIQSPSWWPHEFEKKQQEIIELWHACHVSLVHRTYFFMLFKGDATDSIYIEVELRRLSYLNKALTRESLDRLAIVGQSSSASSMKMLRREREMLCRQMQKRLSATERDNLFAKWGITLKSKQRRMQLVRLLWSKTNDLEHVRESASLVAKLIGLQEEGQALKEMFGLSFIPRQSSRRFYSWRN